MQTIYSANNSYEESISYQDSQQVKNLNQGIVDEFPMEEMESSSTTKDQLPYQISVESRPHEMHFCRCPLCIANDDVKLPLKQHGKHKDAFFNHFELDAPVVEKSLKVPKAILQDKDFNFILKRLQQAKAFITTLKINIPETVCFSEKTPTMIVQGSKVFKILYMLVDKC